MKQRIKRILSIVLTVLILLSLSACTTEELPEINYMVDGNTPVKDITPEFNYYTEGLTIREIDTCWVYKKIDNDKFAQIKKIGAYIENETIRKYVYLPSEIDGDPVVQSTYCSYNQDSQNEKIEYFFVGEGTLETIIVGWFSDANVILPESIVYVKLSRVANIFYIGSKTGFNCVEFWGFSDGIWYGEDYCTTGVKYHYGEDAEPIHVYYYSETEPSEKGVYWHYVGGLPVVWQ